MNKFNTQKQIEETTEYQNTELIGELNMEIPTNTNGDIHYAEIIIEQQKREILDLQATICRLREEMQKIYSSNL